MNSNILKGIEHANAAIEIERAKISKIQEVRDELIDKYLIICSKCEAPYYLKDYTFLQGHWVTGYEDWRHSEFHICHIRCPACSHENYINNHRQRKDLENLQKIKYSLFKKREDKYD